MAAQQRNESRQSLPGSLNQAEDVSLFPLSRSSSLPLVDDAGPCMQVMKINPDRECTVVYFTQKHSW